jgi:hypothetical protein
MDDFERNMRDQLRGAYQPDEAFVARVAEDVAREERRRSTGVSRAAAAAVALIAMLAIGFGLTAPAFADMFAISLGLVAPVLRVAAPVAGILLLAALAFPLAARRR